MQRWMRYDDTAMGGFGATPYGTFFGGGSGGDWGEFTDTRRITSLATTCKSCNRVRVNKVVGGLTLFGSYVEEDAVYLVVADLVKPSTCYSLRIVGEDGETYDLPLTWIPGAPLPLLTTTPVLTAPSPPAGAILVNDVLRAYLPEVMDSQFFDFILVDSCAGRADTIATVYLETEPMIFSPLDADIGGAPRAWLRGARGRSNNDQPATGAIPSIPFDKCLGVIEYDASLGTLPVDQGFTHNGTGAEGDWTLVEGGVLLGTVAAALPSYWTKTLALSAAPGQAYSYGLIHEFTVGSHAAADDGLIVGCKYATSIGAPYRGAYFSASANQWYWLRPDFTVATPVTPNSLHRGWEGFAVHNNIDFSDDQYWRGDIGATSIVSSTVGAAGAIEGVMLWGDYVGTAPGSDWLIRHVCSSFGGRFIRARFTAVAPVSDPVIRIYGAADANSSPDKTIALRVTYASSNVDPYQAGATSVTAVANILVANAPYELAFALTGLTAKAPFYFTVERVWDHADDKLDATFHAHSITVRVT